MFQKLLKNMMQSGIDANDNVIRAELAAAGINERNRQTSSKDVPSRSFGGQLGSLSFERHAEVWTMLGKLPEAVVTELRSQQVGETVQQRGPTSSIELWEISDPAGLKLVADLIRKHGL